VNAPAKSHFEAAAAVDPNEGRSQFFLGLADAQSGNVQQAARIWQSLSQNANSQSEWRTLARQQLAVLSRSQSLDSASAPQIDQDTINEIQNMSVEDRQAMIDGMVAQLDARLSEQGGSVEEWQRLIRARLVLDQREAAQNDLIRALEAFSNDAEKADQLRAFAFELNLSNEAIEAQ
jgi:cytochrome c-type biogenesis protein CcmH